MNPTHHHSPGPATLPDSRHGGERTSSLGPQAPQSVLPNSMLCGVRSRAGNSGRTGTEPHHAGAASPSPSAGPRHRHGERARHRGGSCWPVRRGTRIRARRRPEGPSPRRGAGRVSAWSRIVVRLIAAQRFIRSLVSPVARTLRRTSNPVGGTTGPTSSSASAPRRGRHLPALVFAPGLLGAGPGMLAVNDLPTVVSNLTAWVVGILAGVATLFLTVGGARYLMAGGDPSEVERAKSALRSAALGYALAMLAPVFLSILRQILGA